MTSGSIPRFALTTPLYYVNDLPHIGSAYTTMAADAIARFYRLQGHDVLLITGTDEHGQKIQRTAEQRGKVPQAHCDEIVAGFEDLWQRLNIQYDRFSRTTSPRHAQIVAEFFQRVWDKGDIYQGHQQGWYCVDCEEFKEERELLEEKHCPIHKRPVEWRDEQNYFFRLSNYEDALLKFFADYPDFIQPTSRRNEVLSFVERGLQDFSISRVNLDWGFPVPTDDQHTLYVWFDALLGYVTALLDEDAEPTLENAFSQWWPINLHLIGKDILRFHAVYWPAMLMSADLPLPHRVFGHGFLTKDGQKMGKSLGNTLDPVALVEHHGADAVRYYFLKALEFGRDGDFSETRFIDVVNADLANSLGNLLNRTLKMAVKYCDGKVPDINLEALPDTHPLVQLGREAGDQVANAYQSLNFSQACHIALGLAKAGNQFIDEQAPWSLYQKGEQSRVNEILYTVLESVRLSAYLLTPVIPDLSLRIYQQLGFKLDLNVDHGGKRAALHAVHSHWGALPAQQVLGTPQPVFQKLEPLQAAAP
ncbi:methionine--tRNA ligase [Acaryochloris sp. IP29b_bin.137]|uniref:methionine--tRNA ligase n=1 Tax=Acaryochloris sp. IP29b_bin.137 TaxID=2969217 RepID=UPI002616CC4D|nr:methionine--tRNA ligase [Acaryochloris sp. IP29b_bin.137]